MTAKKRKPLGSAMEEFVFRAQEVASTSAQTGALMSETSPTPEAVLPAPIPPSPESPVAESIPFQSKESSLTQRLQAPDKEATVRFTVDMSESLHRKLSMLAAPTGRKKVDIVRMLLEDGLKEV
ncbi:MULTISPECIES: hypothetical protein [unclassified Microcoleus]|uniref:hypothetical protein n=1 Tax=unclassified Microcoleus TaxID=2642155 RepID=UPI001DF4AE43|nr:MULTISPECIES: hypothetical protein [unclassified Microcoleus]MCC3600085.1 hypothetical protein [Microcoleus sp. PH2017_26_ELK_O_A]MCC3625059.1 hypothetical protein [Microcoleus sp. PH2017_36_ELK_O_B]